MSQGKDKSIFTITSAHDPNSDLTRFNTVNGRFREGRPLRFRRINPRRYPLSLPLTLQAHTASQRNTYNGAFSTTNNSANSNSTNNNTNDVSLLDLSMSNRTSDTDNISLIVLDSPTVRNQTLSNTSATTSATRTSSQQSTSTTTDTPTDDEDSDDVSFLLWDTRSQSAESDTTDDTDTSFTTSTSESEEMHGSSASCAT